ncbi:MAG: HNH endonuclease, partial [Prevotellaceae bacterium]|nr:HNH endonuclease [Prevotellaceae bacterium]
TNKVPVRTDLQIIDSKEQSVKERLYKAQNCLCNGCGNKFEMWNLEVDHIIPSAKGGGNYYENYQLLCGACNKIKGDRPMEYLRQKIETRKKLLKEKIIFGE